jgi:hypothetical protein
MFSEFEVAKSERQRFVRELLENHILAREASEERRARVEEARRRRLCLVRSVMFEVLPTKVANLIAPSCPPCCSPSFAA